MTTSSSNIDVKSQKILILDFGSQYTQLIARRVREAGVYSEIYSYDTDIEFIREFAPSGVILSGGPQSAFTEEAPKADQAIFDLNRPILGICYGMQAMAEQLGGRVQSSANREFGYAEIQMQNSNRLFAGINQKNLDVWTSHGDRVEVMPDGFQSIASTDNAPIAAMCDDNRSLYGLQFHPEVTHTEKGQTIIENFVHKICGCTDHWNPGNIIKSDIKRIREEVGNGQVLLGLSGGVDSSVVAVLLHKAIGDQLTCIFVDNGLLRLDEGDQVVEVFASHLKVNVIRV